MSEESTANISPDSRDSLTGAPVSGSDAVVVPSDGPSAFQSPPESRDDKASSPKTAATGDRVFVSSYKCEGTVRYIGDTAFSGGQWAGVELDQPVGKIDGVVQGKRYFFCKAKHGVFVRLSTLLILPATGKPSSPPSIRDEEHLSSSNVDDSGDYSVGKTPPLRNLTKKEAKPSAPPKPGLKALSVAAPSSAERQQQQSKVALAFDSPEAKPASESVAPPASERPVSVSGTRPKTMTSSASAAATAAVLRVSRSMQPMKPSTAAARSSSRDSRGGAAGATSTAPSATNGGGGAVHASSSSASLDRKPLEAKKAAVSAASSSSTLRSKSSATTATAAATVATSGAAGTATVGPVGAARRATPVAKRPLAGTSATAATTTTTTTATNTTTTNAAGSAASDAAAPPSLASEAFRSQIEFKIDVLNVRMDRLETSMKNISDMIITSLERVKAGSSPRCDGSDGVKAAPPQDASTTPLLHNETSRGPPSSAAAAPLSQAGGAAEEVEQLRTSLLQVAALARESQQLLLAERERHAQEVSELRASVEIESF